VLRQTYSNVEIVVVDDGSTDRTRDVIRSFGGKVKLVCQSNKGVSSARNAGLRECTGEFVVFLDSDDWLSEGLISAQVDAARRWPDADIFGADSAFYQADRISVVVPSNWPDKPARPLELLMLHPPIFISSQMYRWSALCRIGGFDESMRSHEDSDLLIRTVLAGSNIVRAYGGYSVYRRTPNSLTRNALQCHKYGIKFVSKLKRDYLKHYPVLEQHIKQRLTGIRLRYWLAFFSFHMSWRGIEPIKFSYHLLRVAIVDPGYILFVVIEKPWRLPPESAF
jgi:glycosyltransferase involved in cell wall biosynthesis